MVAAQATEKHGVAKFGSISRSMEHFLNGHNQHPNQHGNNQMLSG